MPSLPPDTDPTLEVKRKRSRIERKATEPPKMDKKELAEREEAAQAYAGEDEGHFVRFGEDCVKMSVDSMRDIRETQAELWDIYNEKEPPNFARKELWQSKVVIPKPYPTVQSFLSVVRKGFDLNYLSIENEQDPEAAAFWQDVMSIQLSRTSANFPIQFVDATGMGAAIGQSMEMIPRWVGGGLTYDLIAPSLIHRDPDSLSRQPQSGMYWIHQEWLDYHDLKSQEKDGILHNIPECGRGSNWGSAKENPDLDPQEIKRRQDMIFQQSSFRTKVLTSEFRGTVLDKRGELLMPNAVYTWVGDRVIRLPKQSPYPTLRWPGVGFSPLPHLLRFEGRSLLQGIRSLWYMMCSLMALHVDNLNWIVNPPTEVDITSLVDQDDIDDYPGHLWLTRGSVQGQQVIRTVDRKSNTGDILANMNFADQRFQEGVLFNREAQGLPGTRHQITARESSQNLGQQEVIMTLMGENLEDGALHAIVAGAETVAINMTYKELAGLGKKYAAYAETYRDDKAPLGLKLPRLTSGAFRVNGVSAMMRNQEIISMVANLLMPMFESEVFKPYTNPAGLCRLVENRLNLKNEDLFKTREEMDRVDQAQQAQQEAAIQQQQVQGAAEAQGAEAEAAKHGAQADEFATEAGKNVEQAGLFNAQAGAVVPGAPEGGLQ